MERTLHKVYLHGFLADQYTSECIEVFASNVQEVFQGLVSRFGIKFRQDILHGAWHLIKGKKKEETLYKDDRFMDEKEVTMPVPEGEFHVFPAITGSGGNVGRIILGVVLIIVGIVLLIVPPAGATVLGIGVATIAGALVVAGISSVAGGVIGLLTKPPRFDKFGAGEAVEERPSFLFNGVVNNTSQGVPVPLIYGRHLGGSTVISAGINTIQI